MQKLTNQLILKTGLIFCVLLFITCTETKKEDIVTEEKEIPVLESASQEYADIVQEFYDLLADFNLVAWKEHLAEDITWYWPDGSSETRNTIKGTDNLIAFWEDWKEKTGGKMSFTNNTLLPLKVNKPTNYYKVVGSGVLAYTDMTITLQDKSTSVRQHAVVMFNDDKKISHLFLYYDRSGIKELTNVVFGETE
ncbi:MAG: hypothetical protein ACI9O8_001306 [Patiriisocius sp.]|jgi:hypothetical protein